MEWRITAAYECFVPAAASLSACVTLSSALNEVDFSQMVRRVSNSWFVNLLSNSGVNVATSRLLHSLSNYSPDEIEVLFQKAYYSYYRIVGKQNVGSTMKNAHNYVSFPGLSSSEITILMLKLKTLYWIILNRIATFSLNLQKILFVFDMVLNLSRTSIRNCKGKPCTPRSVA